MAQDSFAARRQTLLAKFFALRRLVADVACTHTQLMEVCHHLNAVGCEGSDRRYCLDCGYDSEAGDSNKGLKVRAIMNVRRVLSAEDFERFSSHLVHPGTIHQLFVAS